MTIGERMKAIRLEKGMTQKELAEKCGMFDSTIRKYETGKQNPKFETVVKIAEALEVDIYDLLSPEYSQTHFTPEIEEILKNFSDKEKQDFFIKISSLSVENTDLLLSYYKKLNSLGKETAVKRVEELTEIEKYTTPDE